MLERFLDTYQPDNPGRPVVPVDDATPAALRRAAGGCSFGGGLYRVHSTASPTEADAWVNEGFPEFGGDLQCFGFDWLGRQFAVAGPRAGHEMVQLLEPGTGEALDTLVHFADFHDQELVDESEPALATGFFGEWRAAGGADPGFSQCVGYVRPLFLGGADDVSNLELFDIDVYWTLLGQMRAQLLGRR